jgi:hypothetical protein
MIGRIPMTKRQVDAWVNSSRTALVRTKELKGRRKERGSVGNYNLSFLAVGL